MYAPMDIACRCPECNTLNFVRVEKNDYYAWKRGLSAQVAFPYLNANQRELIITGICSYCWDKMFA